MLTVGYWNRYNSLGEIAGGNAGSLVGVAISASLLPPVVNSVCNHFLILFQSFNNCSQYRYIVMVSC